MTAAGLTVAAHNASRVYGATNPVFSGTITGIRNGDNITATYATTATITSPVGAYAITPTLMDPGSKLSNYTLTFTNGTLKVTPAALTVAADNASRAYGATNPVFSGTITGIRNGDNLTATYATTATTNSPVGAIRSRRRGDPDSKLGNYTSQHQRHAEGDGGGPDGGGHNASRVYGAANPGFSGTITGVRTGTTSPPPTPAPPPPTARSGLSDHAGPG